MERSYITGRIIATKAQIEAYEDAVLALGAGGGIQSYTLDTGQSRQVVTRADISTLTTTIDRLYNRLTMLEARLYGSTIHARPGW